MMGTMSGEVERLELDDLDDRVYRLIWRGLGTKTPKQISDETGIPAVDIIRFKNEMLESVDVLTLLQRRQKVLINLELLSQEAMDRASSAMDEFKAGLFNSAIAALKEVGRQLAQLQSETDAEVERLNDMRVRELFSIVRESVMVSAKELAITHDLDEDEILSVFSENLRMAAERRDLT